MDNDATTLQKALDTLRQHYGPQLNGPQHGTEGQMRDTLQQQMAIDMSTADDLVDKLCETGQLVYVDTFDAMTGGGGEGGSGTSEGTTTTGPVISMPLTQSADGGAPLITTASPAMVMGIVDYQGGDVGRTVEAGPESLPASDVGEAESVSAQGYWRIG